MKMSEQKIAVILIIASMIFTTTSCGLKSVKKSEQNLSPEHLTLESVYPFVGELGKELKATLRGTQFDKNTKVFMISEKKKEIEIKRATVKNETEILLTIPGPNYAGCYALSVSNETECCEIPEAINFDDADSEIFKAKAILVTGYPANNSNIHDIRQIGDIAYNTLHNMGYADERISYLTYPDTESEINPFQNILDNGFGKLSGAITEWSKDAHSLLIFMVGDGSPNSFRVNDSGQLDAGLLNMWLDNLQDNIPGNIVVIYDACKSGTFVSSLKTSSPKKRIVITGGSPNEDCWILDGGSLSFSYQFWSYLNNKMNLTDAFKKAKNIMMPRQNALIDANGNGIPNEPDDKEIASKIKIANGCISEPTEIIGSISSPQILDGKRSATISIGDLNIARDNIKEVWAEIVPPVDILPDRASKVNFQPSDDNTYQGTYDKFAAKGTYTVVVYLRDKKDVLYSRQTAVTQRKGSPEPRADRYENDDTPAQAKVIVTNDKIPRQHTIHKPEDTDWMKFYARAKKTYRIKVGNLCMICNLIVELYNTDGTTLLIRDDEKNTNGDKFFEWDCPKDGVYYVRVRHSNPNMFGENIRYEIEVYRPSLNTYGCIKGVITDAATKCPIIDAEIVTEQGGNVSSRPNGAYAINQEKGIVTVTVTACGYGSESLKVEVIEGISCTESGEHDNIFNFCLKPLAENSEHQVLTGDINNDGEINLLDAITALQVIAGMEPDKVCLSGDVNDDDKIGLEEVIYILQKISCITDDCITMLPNQNIYSRIK